MKVNKLLFLTLTIGTLLILYSCNSRNDSSLSSDEVTCTKCQGKGIVPIPCEYCDGQGTWTVVCSYCNGKGADRCSNCKGVGKEPCPYCGGIIICKKCNGKGGISLSIL